MGTGKGVSFLVICLTIPILIAAGQERKRPGRVSIAERERMFQCRDAECMTDSCEVYTIVGDQFESSLVKIEDSKREIIPSMGQTSIKLLSSSVWDETQPYWCLAKGRDKGGELECVNGTVTKPPSYWRGTGNVTCGKTADKPQNRAGKPQNKKSTNLMIRLMHESARNLNKSACWMCMHIPESTAAPVVAPIPLTSSQFRALNWGGLGNPSQEVKCTDMDKGKLEEYRAHWPHILEQIEQKAGEDSSISTGLTTVSIMEMATTGGNYGELMTVKSIHHTLEAKARPQMVECTTLLAVTKLGRFVKSIKCDRIGCHAPLQFTASGARSRQEFKIPELHNVTDCVAIIQAAAANNSIIPEEEHGCVGPVHRLATLSPQQLSRDLPSGVVLACGHTAYNYVPERKAATCYLARLVPMIRTVSLPEMQTMHGHHAIHRRSPTALQRFFGILIPHYGVYLNQQEQEAMSRALEAHINSTDKVVTAVSQQLEEVTKVALQNRLALDVILASSGGVCKIIGSECCSYIHSANQSVEDFHVENKKALNNLQQTTAWDIHSTAGNWFSSWTTPFVRNLIAGSVILLIVLGVFGGVVAGVRVAIAKYCTTIVGEKTGIRPTMMAVQTPEACAGECCPYGNTWCRGLIRLEGPCCKDCAAVTYVALMEQV